MERPQFANEEIYHIYNRGVEKRDVFLTEKEYLRFIHCLYEFNDTAPVENLGFRLRLSKSKSDFDSGQRDPRKMLVDILCFCLMPNHYHLLLKQRIEGGITEFMRKLGTGYTNFFNLKYDRVGPLFQGKFKAVHLTKEAHFLYLPHYIHLNPLDLYMPEWREQKIRNVSRALKFLKSYRWSSYQDFIGKKNFPSVISHDPLLSHYRSPTSIVNYQNELKEWLESFDFESIQNVIIE